MPQNCRIALDAHCVVACTKCCSSVAVGSAKVFTKFHSSGLAKSASSFSNPPKCLHYALSYFALTFLPPRTYLPLAHCASFNRIHSPLVYYHSAHLLRPSTNHRHIAVASPPSHHWSGKMRVGRPGPLPHPLPAGYPTTATRPSHVSACAIARYAGMELIPTRVGGKRVRRVYLFEAD